MSERMDQARVEAARDAFYQARWERKEHLDPIRFGVRWADAHPYSTPEDLVAAYEEGQRDAVEKGLANPSIMKAREVAASHPDPRCDRYNDDDLVTCGWKRAYIDMLCAVGAEVRDE